MEVCAIFTGRSDAQLRAINVAYTARYYRPFEEVIKSEFSGHMRSALMAILQRAEDHVLHDVTVLHDCSKTFTTDNPRLIHRLVRVHWDRNHMEMVKNTFQNRYGVELRKYVADATAVGSYKKLMVTLCE
jgi:annexin A7/11